LVKKGANALAHELDTFCSKAVVDFLVSNFLGRMYPLVPVVHIPSFTNDLKNNRQSYDLKFFFLLISMLAATICALPGTFERCKEIDRTLRFTNRRDMLEAAGQLILQLRLPSYFDNLTLDQASCSLMLMFANAQQGLMRRAVMYHAEVTMMIHQMDLHRIGTYHRLNKIDQQRGEKLVWMIFTTER
jgi:hypothetical protein